MTCRLVATVLVCVLTGGCSWFQNEERAPDDSDADLRKIDELTAQCNSERAARQRIKAQKDRLEAENRDLVQRVAAIEADERKCRNRLTGADDQTRQARLELDTRRRELAQASEALQRSRTEWEQALADARRRIDVLENKIRRLTQQLADQNAKAPASRPE